MFEWFEFPWKGYYIKRYNKTIGGHRYFWVRLNKKKLVRHIYDDKENQYLPCDDSFSYDLDNISMESLLTSIELHSNYYVIHNQQENKYGRNIKQSSCNDSELYFYVPGYSKEIKDDKECIFGSIEYFSDNGKKNKHCLYKYVSDDFQTFGVSKNVYELKNTDVFLIKEKELDGLVEGNLYFQGMCIDKFPKYDYNVQKHADGKIEKQYVYEIGKYNQCDFLKVEAWGGGQAGNIEDGKAYNGTPGHYTLGVLKTANIGNKKLMIYVGEGGKFPGQHGEDTVVAVCDNSNFNQCKVVLVARGCTTDECEEKHSSIKDDIVVHYRSATGMSFPSKERDLLQRYNKFIPWGSSYNFPDGTMSLSNQDCTGPVNSWEKNNNGYPGAGGCARVGKSIQQGADGMVRVTCEQWTGNNTNDAKYVYSDGKLCRPQSTNQQDCIKGVCFYSLHDNSDDEPITMFGDKSQCNNVKASSNKDQKVLWGYNTASGKLRILCDNERCCYSRPEKFVSRDKGEQDKITNEREGDNVWRMITTKCWKKEDNPLLSCYINDKQDGGLYYKYRCCYGTNKGVKDSDDICWMVQHTDIIEMFDYSSFPQEVKRAFNNGAIRLLDARLASERQLVSKEQKLSYVYNPENKTFCLDITDDIKNKGCLKSVSVCAKSNNTVDKYSSYKLLVPSANEVNEKLNTFVVGWSSNTCDSLSNIKQNVLKSKLSGNTRIKVFCGAADEKCCYSNNGDNRVNAGSNPKEGDKICVDDENISLSCYGERQGPTRELHTYYKYYCCYKDLTNDSQRQVCWEPAEEDIWEILGFYNMSPEKRQKLKDVDKKNSEPLIINKNSSK